MDTRRENEHAFLDPAAQAERFRGQIVDIAPLSTRLEITLTMPPRLLEGEPTREVLQERLECWLNQYFPNGTSHVEGWLKDVAPPRALIFVTEPAMIARAMDMVFNNARLPDMRPLLDEMREPQHLAASIAERVRACDEQQDGRLAVEFSVPKGHVVRFRSQLFSHYGRNDVSGLTAKTDGPMVAVGATLKGTAADRFISDYTQYKVSH
jgi:hypothetical protein